MDDLNSTLGAILSDPNKMAQLRAVAESLGLNPDGGAPPSQPAQNGSPAAGSDSGNSGDGSSPNTNQTGGIDPASIASILQNFQSAVGGNAGNTPQGNSGNTSPGNAATDPGAVAKITQVISAFNNKNDKNVELMHSLKPHFSPARASRVDDAIRIMQVLRAWPVLRESGLLGNLTNLFGGGRR